MTRLVNVQRSFDGIRSDVIRRSYEHANCEIQTIDCAASAKSVLHHSDHTLLATLEGGGDDVRVHVDGSATYSGPKRKGAAGFFPAGRQLVSIWPEGRLRYLLVSVPYAQIERMLGERLKGDDWAAQAHLDDAFACAALQELAHCITREPNELDDLLADSILTALQLRLVQHSSGYFRSKDIGREPLRQTLRYIEEQLGGPITLSDLSAVSGLPRSRLIAAFRVATGSTPHQYVVRRRLERARHLLANSVVPIGQIAMAVGCANAGHLTKLFNQHLGKSPSAFRHYSERS